MAVDTPSRVNLNLAGGVAPRPLPEFLTTEEPLLRRYNRNHELPLSLATAVGLHLLILMAVAVAGVVFLSLGPGAPPIVEQYVTIEPAMAEGQGEGVRGQEGGFKDSKQPPRENFHYNEQPNNVGDLDLNFDELAVKPNEAPRELAPTLTTDHRGQGADPNRRPGPRHGLDKPGLIGPRHPRLDRRDRWDLALPMQDSAQFLRRLTELEAVVMVPDSGSYLLFDLTKKERVGQRASRSDITRLNRIWYTNRLATACEGIAAELGLAEQPEFFAIFIPQSLEDEMLKKEMAHAGLTEAQLMERGLATTFEVARRPGGWDVKVRRQAPRD